MAYNLSAQASAVTLDGAIEGPTIRTSGELAAQVFQETQIYTTRSCGMTNCIVGTTNHQIDIDSYLSPYFEHPHLSTQTV